MARFDDHTFQSTIQTVSIMVYPTIVVIGVVGNVLVITVILKVRELRNSTNIFLANLATADLINLLICGTFGIVDINSPGMLGLSEKFCDLIPMVAETLTHASVLTILAVSFERFYAICQPLKAGYVCTTNRAYKICLMTWALAAFFDIPYSLTVMTYLQENINDTNNIPVCLVLGDTFWKKALHVSNVLVFFFLPLSTLLVLYSIIARHLREAVASSVNAAATRHCRHVIKMLATVVFCFFTCLLPLRLFTLLIISAPTKLNLLPGKNGLNILWLVSRGMVYLHSAVNPILYSLMSKRFRLGFKNIYSDIKGRKNIMISSSN